MINQPDYPKLPDSFFNPNPELKKWNENWGGSYSTGTNNTQKAISIVKYLISKNLIHEYSYDQLLELVESIAKLI